MQYKISNPVTIRIWDNEDDRIWERLQQANFEGPRPRTKGMLIRAAITHALEFGLVSNPVQSINVQSGTSKENPSKATKTGTEVQKKARKGGEK